MKKYQIIIIAVVVIGILTFLLWPKKNLSDIISIPYISHQKPVLDPQLPTSDPLSDKLDEVIFDGLFNVSANPSGVVYEEGLGEFISIADNIVTIKLKPSAKWHNSFDVKLDDDKVTVSEKQNILFTAQDLNFTLKRIQQLGSLSPDYILVSQAVENFEFSGPDENNEIKFKFKSDRIWTDNDIKEVLSFKIIPASSDLNATSFPTGTGPYLTIQPTADVSNYFRNPAGEAVLSTIKLEPYIDNSTFTTEFKNGNFNVLLSTPFGAVSPILNDAEDFFYKPNISTTFFALLFNTQKLTREQRHEIKKLLSNKKVLDRFFKVGTEQQRNIADYKGNKNNFDDYLNYSVFPSSSYYVEEELIVPDKSVQQVDRALLPDSIRIKVSLNNGHREEFNELAEILNDHSLFGGKVKVTAVSDDEIANGNYDAVLVAFNGYRSTFLFDLYDIFLRSPNPGKYQINLMTKQDDSGKEIVDPNSFKAANNFFRLDAQSDNSESEDINKLLDYTYKFMSTREIGDKQQYAIMIDELERNMALGVWLFSLPSLNYFSTQFDSTSINLYGVSSQFSTIEKWREKSKK